MELVDRPEKPAVEAEARDGRVSSKASGQARVLARCDLSADVCCPDQLPDEETPTALPRRWSRTGWPPASRLAPVESTYAAGAVSGDRSAAAYQVHARSLSGARGSDPATAPYTVPRLSLSGGRRFASYCVGGGGNHAADARLTRSKHPAGGLGDRRDAVRGRVRIDKWLWPRALQDAHCADR